MGGSCVGCKCRAEASAGERDLCGDLSPGRSKQKGKFGETLRASIWDTICWQDGLCKESAQLLAAPAKQLFSVRQPPPPHVPQLFWARLGGLAWRQPSLKSSAVLYKEGSQVCRRRAEAQASEREALGTWRLELFRIEAGEKDKVRGQQSAEDRVLQC